jgi:acyl-coenzyme A thioesterase PaaI-like protein
MRDVLQQLLDGQPKPVCAQLTPFRIIDADLDAGSVRLEFAPQPAFGNHFGNVQGGFAVAMIDVLLSVCAYAKYRLWLPTAEIKTSFLEPLPIDACIGEGKVIKAGRSLAFLEGTLMRADGRPAIAASATAMVPTQRQ